MKSKNSNSANTASLLIIGLIAIAAVAIALYQVNRPGTVAPTAPESQPQAVQVNSETCSVAFTVPAPASADLELRKIVDDSSPDLGQNITFTLELTNKGPNEATGVVVQDVLPTGVIFVSANPSRGTFNQNSGSWNVGNLEVNGVVTLQIVATVNSTGTITNYAQVTSSGIPDPDSTPGNNSGRNGNPNEDDDDLITLNSTDPNTDLDLVKRVNNSSPQIGENVTFTIEVRNAGPRNATNVSVQDVLGTGLTYVSHSTAAGTYNSETGIWTIGNLNVNQSVELDLVARVDAQQTTENYAQIQTGSPQDTDSTPGNNSGRGSNPSEDDDGTVVINPQVTPTPTQGPGNADLVVDKKVSNSTPEVGQEITYTIEVYNSGPEVATDVQLRDPLVGGLTYLSHTTSQGTYNQSNGLWNIGTIAVNEVKSLTIRVRVEVDGSLTNVAQITQNNPTDPNLNNNRDTQTINSNVDGADLSLTKRVNNSTPNIGDNVTFTVDVHNSGPEQAEGVTVKDVIPQGVTFISANPSQGNYNSGSGIWTIGTITKDSTVRMELVVRVDNNSGVRNIAEVQTSNTPDPDSTPGNNNPNEDDYDEAILGPRVELPKAGGTSRTTLFVLATGVVVLIIGAMSLLLLL